MEEALVAYLLQAGSPVLAAVERRVQWGTSPQGGPMPRIVLNRIDGSPVYSDDGDEGLVESRVQADCYGATFPAATAVARSVKSRLSGVQVETGGVEFQTIMIDAERNFFEVAHGGQETHRVSIDLILWHRSD